MINYQKEMTEKKFIGQPIFETIAERVRRHLKDINSKITDDDIRNVRLDLEVNPEKFYGDLLHR
jgi:hypothetical protein